MPTELWKHGWCSYRNLAYTITEAFEHECPWGESVELNHYTDEDMDWAAEEVTSSLETLLNMVGWKIDEMVR